MKCPVKSGDKVVYKNSVAVRKEYPGVSALHRVHTDTSPARVSSSELVRSHQVLLLVRVEWQIQDVYQAEAASFIVNETEKTKQNKTKILGSPNL